MGLINALNRHLAMRREFPEAWHSYLRDWFPGYEGLKGAERERFETHLKIFVFAKHWVGVKGLEVTVEMKVVISASAARIARNLPFDVYDALTEIVIYPGSYGHADRDYEVLGEAHNWGTVVLSWDAVRHGISVPNDGHDTAVHEFAHVLDISDGWFDGTPDLGGATDDWARVMGEHFERLRRSELGRDVMRDYGATNEAEFFAVATEAFFEKPKKLRRHAPALYEELREYFRVDPVEVDESISRT